MDKMPKNIDAFYKIKYGHAHNLSHVKLENDGLEKIAIFYQEKYKSNISIGDFKEAMDDPDGSDDENSELDRELAAKRIEAEIATVKEGEVRGFVLNKIRENEGYPPFIAHSSPFILAKIDRSNIVVDFEKKYLLKSEKYTVKNAKKYKGMQKDEISCGVFSINILKNCLRDPAIIDQIGGAEEIVGLKTIMGQSTKFIDPEKFEEKSKFYLHKKFIKPLVTKI